jgi:hypothetical protein
MVAKDGCKRYLSLDHRSNDFEKSGLGVENVMMQLVSGKDHEVGLLSI